MEERQKILIVDDERFNINVLVDLLKPNYKIMVAINGKQALKAARTDSPPDLILLDIMMPEMDGYEVCQRLKADEKTHEIPVIFVTAMGQESDETKGLEIGAVDYITKPISAAIVEARVKVQLERKEAVEAVAAAHARIQLLKKIAFAANEASTIEDALQICLDEVCSLTGWPVGHVYILARDGSGDLITAKLWHLDKPRKYETFRQVTEEIRLAAGIGMPGRVLSSGKPTWIIDVTKDINFPRAKLAENIGVKAAFCFPVLVGSKVAAVLEFFTPETVEPDEQLLEVMAQVGTQLGRVIERKQAEEAIASSHACINHILASSPAVVYSFEATGDYSPTFISENICDVFGYEPSEYLADPNFVSDRIHPDDAARVSDDLSQLFKDGHVINEYRLLHKDGSYCWVSDELRVIYDDAGKPVEVVGSWSDVSARKMVKEKIVDLLSGTSLFGSLDESALRDVAAEANSVQLMGGMQLIQQGDPADSFYLVISGRIRTFTLQDNGTESPVGEVGRGELVGETAVLTGEPQPVSARAIRDTDLLQFSNESFSRLVERSPKAVLLLSKNIASRYQREIYGTNVNTAISTIAVLPAGHGVSLSDFTKPLATALSAFGATILLDNQRVEQALGKESLQKQGKDQIIRWLNDLEFRYQYVIYESTLEPSSWTHQCIRHADRILLVGVAGSNAALNSIERDLLIQQNIHPIARQELILLHQNKDKLPTGTKQWIDSRNVANHHHLVVDNTEDYKRLSRFLTGHAISIVLGGGGARGCAHIGLLRALQDLHIPIDSIGGTSIGATLASCYALGLNPEEILSIIDKLWLIDRPMRDFTLPIVSLITGRKLNKVLQKMYGDARIEDLWVNNYSVSANLTRASTEVHREGLVWKGVRASMSIPGHIPPIVLNGDLHVDGGVLNNLPVDVMHEICDGIIIANNVSPQVDLKVAGSSEGTYSGWDYFLNALRPSSKKLEMPNILNILMRSGSLYSIKAINVSKAMADIYLHPPIDKYELLDLEPAHEIEEIGYQYTLNTVKKHMHDNELLKQALVN